MKYKVQVLEQRNVMCEYIIDAEDEETAVEEAEVGNYISMREMEKVEVTDRSVEGDPEEA